MSVLPDDATFLADLDKQIGFKPVARKSVSSKIAGYRPLERTTGNKDYDKFYDEEGRNNDIDPNLLFAQGHQESSFNPNARSNKNASGIAQFIPDTAAEFGVNVKDPRSSINGQARLMRKLLDRTGDIDLALAGYNSGHNLSVERLRRNKERIPETRDYVAKIRKNYNGTPQAPSITPDDNKWLADLDQQLGLDAPVVLTDDDNNFLADLDKQLGLDVPKDVTTTDVTSPVPESPDALQKQIVSTFDANSPKSMTLLTKDNPANNFILSMAEARRLTRVDTPNGIVLVNAKKLGIKPSEATEYVKKNGFAKDSGFVIDMGNNTGDGQPAVAAVDPNTGKEVFAAVTPTPESAQAQAQQNQAMFPGTVQVPTDTDEVTAKRQDDTLEQEYLAFAKALNLDPKDPNTVKEFNLGQELNNAGVKSLVGQYNQGIDEQNLQIGMDNAGRRSLVDQYNAGHRGQRVTRPTLQPKVGQTANTAQPVAPTNAPPPTEDDYQAWRGALGLDDDANSRQQFQMARAVAPNAKEQADVEAAREAQIQQNKWDEEEAKRASTPKAQKITDANKYDAVAESVAPPDNLTEAQANEYIRKQLTQKYGGNYDTFKFLTKYEPGKTFHVTYGDLKSAGVDIDALLSEQKAQKRVEQPTDIMPFVGQYTPQKQVTMPDGRIAYEDGDTIRKGLPGTEDGIAPTVFQQIQGLTDDEVKGQNTAWKYKFDSLYRQAVNTVAEVGGSKKDIDAEYARLMANEDMERDAALKYGKEQGERYGSASSGFVGSGGESVAYPAAIMRALNTLVPGLNDIGGRKLQNWLTNSSLAMAQAQATESEKNPDNVSSIIRMGAGAPGFLSRLGVSTMLPGGAQLTFAKDAAIKSFGQGNDVGQVFKDTGVGLATDLLFKGGSALGGAVKKGALKKLLTKEAIEVVENGGLDFAYKGTDAAKKAFINAARRSLVADSAGMVTRLGVIGGGTYAMATAEGSKTPGKDTAMMLLFDLVMHAKKIGKMAKLSTQVWRVPGEKPDAPARDVMLLTEGGDKIAVYDVTGKYPPEAIEGVISRVPGADADRSAFESRPMGGQTVVPLPEKNPVKTKSFIPKIEPDDITESEKSPKIDLSVEKAPKDSLGDDTQKAADKENARIAQGQLDDRRKEAKAETVEDIAKSDKVEPVRVDDVIVSGTEVARKLKNYGVGVEDDAMYRLSRVPLKDLDVVKSGQVANPDDGADYEGYTPPLEEIEAAIKDGTIDPVIVENGSVVDGFHRIAVAHKLGMTDFPAYVKQSKAQPTKSIATSPVRERAKAKAAEKLGVKGEAVDEKPQPLSNTQIEFSPEQAKPFDDFRKNIIDPKDVADKSVLPEYAKDGIFEIEPHVTVKYGLHTNNHEDVIPQLQGEKPIAVELGKTSVFKGSEKKIPGTDKPVPYDVVTVEVKSPDLERLNKKLTDGSKNTTTFPYSPHVTLAYVKSGEGEKYAGKTDFEGQKYTFDGVTFSPADKSGKQVIPLAQPKAEAVKEPHEMTLAEAQVAKVDSELPKNIVLSDFGGNYITKEKNGAYKVWKYTDGGSTSLAGTIGFKGDVGLERAKQRLAKLSADSHKLAVSRAVRDGKTVPQEVLSEYPDLAKLATRKAERATNLEAAKQKVADRKADVEARKNERANTILGRRKRRADEASTLPIDKASSDNKLDAETPQSTSAAQGNGESGATGDKGSGARVRKESVGEVDDTRRNRSTETDRRADSERLAEGNRGGQESTDNADDIGRDAGRYTATRPGLQAKTSQVDSIGVVRVERLPKSIYGDASVPKSNGNALTRDAHLLRSLTQSKTFRNEGLSGFNVPSQRRVMNAMLRRIQDLKVRNIVIQFIPVNVVDALINSKGTPQMSLHDKSVLKNAFAIQGKTAVSIRSDVADALIVVAAGDGTKGFSRRENLILVSAELSSTVETGKVRLGHDTDLQKQSIVSKGESGVESDSPTSSILPQNSSENILRSVADTPFYSRVESVIRDKMPPRATSAQVTALLAKNSVKELDPEFQALKVWLEDQGSVSKDDVLAFVAANRTAVSEVVKGRTPTNDTDYSAVLDGFAEARFGKPYSELSETQRLTALEETEGSRPMYVDDTSFSQWQLPGESENYREEFITAPAFTAEDTYEVRKMHDEKMGEYFTVWNTRTDENAAWGYPQRSEESMTTLAESFNKNAKGRGKLVNNWQDGHEDYNDVVNPIARIRYNDRTTTDGDKMLFGEEFQQPSKENLAKMPKVYQKFGEQMAIRKMLYRAVEGGYDYFGFTTGQQQADRYDLSKQVKAIKWLPSEAIADTTIVRIFPNEGSPIAFTVDGNGKVSSSFQVDARQFEGKDLVDVVGKDAAAKIAQSAEGRLEGLDLKVGGEGLINRYDRKHVDYINKLMKPYGVSVESKSIVTEQGNNKGDWAFRDGRIEETKFGDFDLFGTRKDTGEEAYLQNFDTRAEAERELKLMQGDDSSIQVHAVRISPEFRKAVEASIREHGGAFPLFKVAEPTDIADIEALGKGDFKELFNDIKSDVKSDATGANILDLGTNKTIELVRTAFAYMYDTPLEGTAIPGGMYLDPSQTNDFRDALQGISDAASENGVESKGVDTLIKNLDKAAKDGDVRVIGFDDTLPHETIHQQSRRGAIDKELSQRYSDDGLGDDRVFKKFHKKLIEIQGKASLAVAREEALAYLSSGDYARFGLTEAEATEIVAKLIESYAQKNGVESLKTFDGTQAYEAVENYYRKIESRETSNDSRSGVSSERETRPDTAQAERAENDTGERGETFTPGGREKLSQTPKTMRGNGFDKVEDRSYTSTTNAERTDFANDILDKGVNAARTWLDTQLADGNNNAGATQAVGLTLMNHYAKNGGIEAMNEIAKKIVTKGTDNAQAVQAMSIVSQFDPESAAAYASLLKQRKRGQDLTDAERQRATNIAENLDETAKVEALAQAALDDALAYNEQLKAENEAIAESLASKPKESKADVANIKRQLTRWKNKALGINNTVGRVTRTHRDLLTRKDDLMARLREKFPDKENALRMVAWHGSPHTFDKFDISKIGTGEGNQAYGHGLYFTSSEDVADYYKEQLAKPYLIDSQLSDDTDLTDEIMHIMEAGGVEESVAQDVHSEFVSLIVNAGVSPQKAADQIIQDFKPSITPNAQSGLREFATTLALNNEKGNKYRVDLKPSEDEYLLWDKPLSEQSEKVKKALRAAQRYESHTASQLNGRDLYDIVKTDEAVKAGEGRTAAPNTIRRYAPAASDYLKSLGIRGIKYLDGTSRGKGEGSYNYVIFDDADVEIQEVLRSIPSKSFDDQTRQDLIDYTALQILEGKTYKETIDNLSEIAKDTLNDDEIKAIHANAVDAIRGERPQANMSADKLNEVREKIKVRNEHKRAAREFHGANKNPNLSRLERELLEIAPDDRVRIASLILARTPNLNEWFDTIEEVYPDITKAEKKELYIKATDLNREAKKNLTRKSMENRQGIALSDQDIERIREERRVNMANARRTMKEAENFYNGLVRTKGDVTAETIVNLRRANLLTGIKTHARNIFGNIAFGTSEEVMRSAAWLADLMTSAVTGERTVQGIAPVAITKSFANIIGKDETLKNIDRESGIKAAMNILKSGDTLDNLERQQHGESILSEKFTGKVSGVIAKGLDTYINGVFRTLGAEDALFKVYAFRRSLEEQAKVMSRDKDERKALITNPTQTMIMVADDFANFMTFQNDNMLSRAFTKFKKIHPAIKTAAETIVPYDRTPTNIVIRVTESLPIVGTALAAKQAYNIKSEPDKFFRNRYRGAVEADLTNEEWNNLDANEKRKRIDDGIQKVWSREKQAKFARTFGRSSVGTSLFMTGFFLSAAGLLTGSMSPEDDDRAETSEFFKRMKMGVDNKSIRIPGVGRFKLLDDPASKTLAAGATFYEQMQMNKGDAAYKAWGAAKEVAYDTFTEQPLLGNVGSLYSTIKKGKVGEFTGNLAGGYIPTLVSDIGEAEDEFQRTGSSYKKGEKINTVKDMLNKQGRGFTNSFLKRIPIVRHNVDKSDTSVPQDVRGGMLRRAIRSIDLFNSRPDRPYTAPASK